MIIILLVISKTLKGITNSAAATALSIEKFNPIAIINQGTAGGIDPNLQIYDIVLGVTLVNIGAMKTAKRELGQRSNFMEWRPLDYLLSEESTGENPLALTLRKFYSDAKLLEIAKSIANTYTKGKVLEGTISSGEIWNSELDRIKWLRDKFASSVEEGEGASAAQISHLYKIPFLSVRIVGNNITNNSKYNASTAEYCQKYVYDFVKAYIKALRS